jgi:uncharacterized protein
MHPSNIAELRSIDLVGPAVRPAVKPAIRTVVKPPLKRRIASISRWLHIYISAAASVVLLFFSGTGLILNHQEWFSGRQKTNEYRGEMDVKWVKASDSKAVAKLEIVEYLRQARNVKGALTDFRIEDAQCALSFKGPGYAADAIVDRETGRYQLIENHFGFVAVISDLHKARDTGSKWGMVLDISAVFIICVSLTGLILVFYLIKRRTSALVILGIGGALLLYAVFAP